MTRGSGHIGPDPTIVLIRDKIVRLNEVYFLCVKRNIRNRNDQEQDREARSMQDSDSDNLLLAHNFYN